jgi:hypothetical protein
MMDHAPIITNILPFLTGTNVCCLARKRQLILFQVVDYLFLLRCGEMLTVPHFPEAHVAVIHPTTQRAVVQIVLQIPRALHCIKQI